MTTNRRGGFVLRFSGKRAKPRRTAPFWGTAPGRHLVVKERGNKKRLPYIPSRCAPVRENRSETPSAASECRKEFDFVRRSRCAPMRTRAQRATYATFSIKM